MTLHGGPADGPQPQRQPHPPAELQRTGVKETQLDQTGAWNAILTSSVSNGAMAVAGRRTLASSLVHRPGMDHSRHNKSRFKVLSAIIGLVARTGHNMAPKYSKLD